MGIEPEDCKALRRASFVRGRPCVAMSVGGGGAVGGMEVGAG